MIPAVEKQSTLDTHDTGNNLDTITETRPVYNENRPVYTENRPVYT